MLAECEIWCPYCLKDDMLDMDENGNVYCLRCGKEIEGLRILRR